MSSNVLSAAISVVVLTYNWPQALALCLDAIAQQSRLPLEVIVADDGSGQPTRALVESIASHYPVPLRHLWQEDRGFRAGAARNRGLAHAHGDYIILLDGDMIAHPELIADHLTLAEAGAFLAGGRLRASTMETKRLMNGHSPRFHPLMSGIFDSRNDFHRYHALRWRWLARRKACKAGRVMSCNMSFWRADALTVNGFDERMEGYGSEDLEFAARLRNIGLRQKQLKFTALAVHLEHASRAPVDPDNPQMPNNKLLAQTRQKRLTRCEHGMDQYL